MHLEQKSPSSNDRELIPGDRRDDRRYTMQLQLEYKLIHRNRVVETGTGSTVDLSSGGILFETDKALPRGLNVELAINWPVLLHNVVPIRLVVTGRIVRSLDNRTAIRTTRHEFRTQGSQSLSPRNGARTPEKPINPTAGHTLRLVM